MNEVIEKENIEKQEKVQKENKSIKYDKIKSSLKRILLEFVELFIIFNLINIMQFVISFNNKLMGVFFMVKKVGWEFEKIFDYIIKINLFDSIYWLNLLVAVALYVLIYVVSNRRKLSLIITTSLLFLFETVNYIVTAIRGTALSILDILSVKTAINVAKGLKIKFNAEYICGMLIFVMIIIIICVFSKNSGKLKIRTRIIGTILSVSCLMLIMNSQTVKGISIWDINITYMYNGTNLTILRQISDLNVKEPDNYDKKTVKSKLEQYKANNTKYDNDTNIIVVMNESFADYTQNTKISLKEDNIPFFHSLQNEDNVITGTLHSEALGTNTANIEYEFFTQNTIAFLPSGAVPYQQYINTNIESIVSRIEKLNYKTYALHTWKKSGYNREKIYELLGFDSYKFKEDFTDLEYGENRYTTDKSTYSKIIDLLNNKKANEKIFSFNLTIANHIPYATDEKNTKVYSDNETVNEYLKLENESDLALEELVNYLKQYNEKVVLLFFGDHQPNLEVDEIINDEENKYKVPYLIWANYDIEEKEYNDTSANYLQSILLEVIDAPKDEYTNYITELRNKIPVLTKHYYIGRNGEKYNIDDTNSPYYEDILEYEKIVYYQMFDNK